MCGAGNPVCAGSSQSVKQGNGSSAFASPLTCLKHPVFIFKVQYFICKRRRGQRHSSVYLLWMPSLETGHCRILTDIQTGWSPLASHLDIYRELFGIYKIPGSCIWKSGFQDFSLWKELRDVIFGHWLLPSVYIQGIIILIFWIQWIAY